MIKNEDILVSLYGSNIWVWLEKAPCLEAHGKDIWKSQLTYRIGRLSEHLFGFIISIAVEFSQQGLEFLTITNVAVEIIYGSEDNLKRTRDNRSIIFIRKHKK